MMTESTAASMNTCILGGGLAGMACSFITHSPVISPNLGGQIIGSVLSGPRIMEDDKDGQNRWFANELELILHEPRRFKIHRYAQSTPEYCFREVYCHKTRGLVAPGVSNMSSGKEFIEGWDMKEVGLIRRLANSVDHIQGTVRDMERMSAGGYRIHYYDDRGVSYHIISKSVISTIPHSILCATLGMEDPQLEALDTYFVRVSLAAVNKSKLPNSFYRALSKLDNLDYMYIIDTLPFHRAQRVNNDIVLEYNKLNLPNIDTYLFIEELHVKGWRELKRAQLIPGDIQFIPDITSIGRYAEWDHRVKLEHVIKKGREFNVQNLGKTYGR